MTKRVATKPVYAVSIGEDPASAGALRFTFAPRSDRTERETPSPAPQFVAVVRGHGSEATVRWIKRPKQEGTREELEAIARGRTEARHEWLERLTKLVATVRAWTDELDWATKVVAKHMEDAEIGGYEAPALLLQEETVRLFLEPVARKAPGTEGVVDLCLMPSYDDVASLYFQNNRWNVQYVFEGNRNGFGAEAKPLTKATLRKLLDEMKAHAG